MSATIAGYCQFQLSSQVNYTLTYFADHTKDMSHDRINRLLRRENVKPSELWRSVQPELIPSERGYVIFDDTVLDKRFSSKIEAVRRQWSGNEHRVIKGIGVVTCIYVNPETEQFWAIDYRIYNPDVDGRDKNDHVKDMLHNVVEHKGLPFRTVLMDSWYASLPLMRMIEGYGKIYYCPVKKNRLVDETDGVEERKAIEDLTWSERDLQEGKLIHLNQFPQGHRVKLFRLTVLPNRMDFIVTNDLSQDSADATRLECAVRWKIEELHRELKQVTGIEKCECRKERIQRNHIGCAMLVWAALKKLACQTGKTIYQLKQGLLDNYMAKELVRPAIRFKFA
ncbi:MAG: IS701 family transposase [Microcystaceae cyanobacterium]